MSIDQATEHASADTDPTETREWLEALDAVLEFGGADRVRYLLSQLQDRAWRSGVGMPFTANTPYLNTIPTDEQPPLPGTRRRRDAWSA